MYEPECPTYATSLAETLKKGIDNPSSGKPAKGGGAGKDEDDKSEDDDEGEEAPPLTEEQLTAAEAEMEGELAK